jgi:hypothetical protein
MKDKKVERRESMMVARRDSERTNVNKTENLKKFRAFNKVDICVRKFKRNLEKIDGRKKI